MSDSPRTDAERARILTARISYEDKFDEMSGFARKLERALAEEKTAHSADALLFKEQIAKAAQFADAELAGNYGIGEGIRALKAKEPK